MTFTGTWDEIREAAFCACLLAYGPRPRIPRGDFEHGLDRLFEWDSDVDRYLAVHLPTTRLSDRRTNYSLFLEWMEGRL